MSKPNKAESNVSYIDGGFVKSHPPPEVIVVKKAITIKENKDTTKKQLTPNNQEAMLDT